MRLTRNSIVVFITTFVVFITTFGYPADKQIEFAKNYYTIDEQAPEFGSWYSVIRMAENLTDDILIIVLQFANDDATVTVMAGMLHEHDTLCLVGIDVYYLETSIIDHYGNLEYIEFGECSFKLSRIKDGGLVDIVPPFLLRKIDAAKTKT